MPMLSLSPSLLRSRFGRRLLLLFIVCSLLPTAALALLSFGTVTRQLRQASLDRLEHSGRLLGSGIVERLRFLSQDLAQVPARATPCPSRGADWAGPACDGSLEYGLVALTFVPELGKPIRFFATAPDAGEAATLGQVLALSESERGEIGAGRDVVLDRAVAGSGGQQRVIYIVHPVETGGMLVGEVNARYLWGTPDQIPLVPTMEFHVVNGSGRLITRSPPGEELPADVRAGLAGQPTGSFEWEIGRVPYLAAFAPIPASAALSAPQWTLIVSEAWAAVVAPMAQFKKTFPIVIAIALGAALVLSLSQLRRSLAPLQALHEGTQRLSRRQFDNPVAVASQDEFAEVAASFNAMTDQIKRQFTALASAADIERAVLSSVDTNRIVRTVLERIPDVCACDIVGVTLIDPAGSEEVTTYVEAPDGSPVGGATTWVAKLDRAERERLASGPIHFTGSQNRVPEYLAPLLGTVRDETNSGSLLVLPLRYQTELLGAITLGSRATIGRGEEDLVQAKRVAGQVALALSNARMVDQIRSLAFYDSLTGLPNRVSFKRRLSEELERSIREERMVAVCFLDLDHFSRINDTLGHKLGDRLVQEVGARVKACCLEAAPGAEVARLGGDEFTVIVPDLASPRSAASLARQILASFDTPFALDGHEVFVSTSVGVAIHPTDGTDLENLLKNADTAMYEAKKKGRNRMELYADAMSASAVRRLTLENQLRKALEAGHFVLWYQPIADLASGRIASAEALIRWEHPEWGTVSPGEFIAVCEESGLIVPVGEWILRTVCEQNLAWQRQGLPAIPIAINISGQQLRTDNTADTVRHILQTTGLDPHHLVLELTESILMQEGDASAILASLASLGIGLAIDDFGTGYSSLSYLKHFPVNTLKIDKSFIREVTTNPDDAAITSAIIAMGSALGLRIIAEGVETAAQMKYLRQQGCHGVQGYLVGHPVEAEVFTAYLQHDGPIASLRSPGLPSEEAGRRAGGRAVRR